jgi:2-polyprenyl-3-methyl-5-hydroxy-6-metoxy-1,4-benzoquinol methylase
MSTEVVINGYQWRNADQTCIHADLMPTVDQIIQQFTVSDRHYRLFDLGCGNGSIPAYYTNQGFDVTGVDPSESGIQQAQSQYPGLKIYAGSAYDNLAQQYGQFPIVLSLEVVEHVYSPRDYAKTLYSLVEPNGIAIVSTPYHGYWKNLALALAGHMDQHHSPLWDHGHIKFWSMVTLSKLLQEVGFQDLQFYRVGRIPALAKSMIAVAHK